MDLRLSYLDSGLAVCRPHRAGQRFERTTVLTPQDVDRRCGRRGRGRSQLKAVGCGDRRDDDEQAGDTHPANPNPTGRRSCGFAVGHAPSLGSVVLPARIGFSICRRYAPARSIWSMRVLLVEDEPYMAEAIRDGLRLEAIAADVAGDGDTALKLLSFNAYD